MTEPRAMDEPVTRRELHEALAIWGGNLEHRLGAEMARQIQASEERMRDFLRARMDPRHGVPERVIGLEARVDRLEAKELAPKRRRRRPSR